MCIVCRRGEEGKSKAQKMMLLFTVAKLPFRCSAHIMTFVSYLNQIYVGIFLENFISIVNLDVYIHAGRVG